MARSASRMIRKQIYIETGQNALLKRLAAEAGVSEAEIIRQSVVRYALAARPTVRDADAWRRQLRRIRASIGKGPLPGKRTWTRDDLYAARLQKLD
jgi:hypothetical protein